MHYHFNPDNYFPQLAKTQNAAGEKRLAEAYVPNQRFRELYTPEDALKYGTVFRELNTEYRRRDKK